MFLKILRAHVAFAPLDFVTEVVVSCEQTVQIHKLRESFHLICSNYQLLSNMFAAVPGRKEEEKVPYPSPSLRLCICFLQVIGKYK